MERIDSGLKFFWFPRWRVYRTQVFKQLKLKVLCRLFFCPPLGGGQEKDLAHPTFVRRGRFQG
jgi:hypothetical protein